MQTWYHNPFLAAICAVSFRGSASLTNKPVTPSLPLSPCDEMKQVWFSWQVNVNEVSIQLSQPTPPPSLRAPRRIGRVAPGPSPSLSPSPAPSPAQEEGSGIPLSPVPLSEPLTGGAEGLKEEGRGGSVGTVVLLLVVYGARVRVGIRTEKGFVMHGSVHAVGGSGVGGATCLAINPAVLWGEGREGGGFGGGDGAGKSMGCGEAGAQQLSPKTLTFGVDSENFVFRCLVFSRLMRVRCVPCGDHRYALYPVV